MGKNKLWIFTTIALVVGLVLGFGLASIIATVNLQEARERQVSLEKDLAATNEKLADVEAEKMELLQSTESAEKALETVEKLSDSGALDISKYTDLLDSAGDLGMDVSEIDPEKYLEIAEQLKGAN